MVAVLGSKKRNDACCVQERRVCGRLESVLPERTLSLLLRKQVTTPIPLRWSSDDEQHVCCPPVTAKNRLKRSCSKASGCSNAFWKLFVSLPDTYSEELCSDQVCSDHADYGCATFLPVRRLN